MKKLQLKVYYRDWDFITGYDEISEETPYVTVEVEVEEFAFRPSDFYDEVCIPCKDWKKLGETACLPIEFDFDGSVLRIGTTDTNFDGVVEVRPQI